MSNGQFSLTLPIAEQAARVDRGAFADVPFDTLMREFRATYPHLFEPGALCGGEFRNEAFAGDAAAN